jgi:hypothetical protein
MKRQLNLDSNPKNELKKKAKILSLIKESLPTKNK